MSDSEYIKAIEELVLRFREVGNFADSSATQPVLERICGILRIGAIEGHYYDTPAHEARHQSRVANFFDGGNAVKDPSRAEAFRQMTENNSVTNIMFFPIAGNDGWTDEEKQRILILYTMIFTFAGRANLLAIAADLTYNDSQLEVRNLNFFMRKVGELIGRRMIGDYGTAYFNLKHFSVVNNQVGRDEGTVIMKKYIHGFSDKLQGEECVCRIGGDNFIVLFRKEHLETVCMHLSGVNVKSDKFHAEFVISSYAGFYMFDPSEIHTPSDVMDRAVTAVNIAKKNHGSPFVFYDSEVQERMRNTKRIEDMVPDAIRNEEFLVFYQPKVDLKTYTLAGAEALCRWQHDGEMVPPIRFIPVLERSKLICELDFYMLDHVCRDIRRWLDEGKKVVKISVNLSRVHLGDANLLDDIIGTVDRHNVPHKYIEIELTETTTDVDYGELKRIVNGLREVGISTSVDDFGIGYSSLNLIRELPWNVLKIDKSFLPDGTGSEKQRKTMLKYVIAMAQELGLECIVEGVETVDQVVLLKENNCFLAQGFYFDRPLPVAAFEQRLMM